MTACNWIMPCSLPACRLRRSRTPPPADAKRSGNARALSRCHRIGWYRASRASAFVITNRPPQLYRRAGGWHQVQAVRPAQNLGSDRADLTVRLCSSTFESGAAIACSQHRPSRTADCVAFFLDERNMTCKHAYLRGQMCPVPVMAASRSGDGRF